MKTDVRKTTFSDMNDPQLDQSIALLQKERAVRDAQAQNLIAECGNSAASAGMGMGIGRGKTLSPREALDELLLREEKKALERIGELQDIRRRLDGMYLSDVEGVLELHYRLRPFSF